MMPGPRLADDSLETISHLINAAVKGKVVAAPLCRGSDAEHGNTVP